MSPTRVEERAGVISATIGFGFAWDMTQEGFEFWSRVQMVFYHEAGESRGTLATKEKSLIRLLLTGDEGKFIALAVLRNWLNDSQNRIERTANETLFLNYIDYQLADRNLV